MSDNSKFTPEENIKYAQYIREIGDQQTPYTTLKCGIPECKTMVDIFVIPPFGSSIGARCPEHGWDVTVNMDPRNPLPSYQRGIA